MSNNNNSSKAFLLIDLLADMQAHGIEPAEEIYAYLSRTDTQKLGRLVSILNLVKGFDTTQAAERHKSWAVAKGQKPTKKKKYYEGKKSALVGKLLERCISVILDGCNCIYHSGNIRTTVSEIDFLIATKPGAGILPLFQKAGTHLIGEAKCYSSGLKSEWINELVGIMQAHMATHSILFSAGPERTLRTDHRHVIQLHVAKGNHVIPFGMRQIRQVIDGGNFLKILNDQFVRSVTGSVELSV